MTTRGLLSAQEIRRISPNRREFTIQASADNAPIKILYGELSIAGEVFQWGIESGDLVVGVAWCYGEIDSIVRTYVNDEELPISGVSVTHYTGTTWQTADPDLVAAIAAYSDDMVLRTPEGDVGIAYSVFRIDPGAISSSPQFRVVAKGAKVDDPRPSSDPIGSDLWLVFDSETPTDQANSRTITVADSVTIEGGFATNSAVSEGVSIGGSFTFGTGDFCIEAKCKAPGTSGTFEIYRGRIGATDVLGILVVDGNIRVFAYEGATLEVFQDVTAVPEGEFDVSFGRNSGTFFCRVNGDEEWTATVSTDIDTPTTNRTCFSSSGPRFASVRSLRISLGDPRYTARHEVRGLPFADCRRYSDNSALCFGDLATHSVYGMGAKVSGLAAAADWNDTLINSLVPRCRLALAITRPQLTESYLDLLATYSELIWFWEGSGVSVIADSAVDTGSVDVESNCIAGSLRVEGVDDDDTPTRVYARYTLPDLTSPNWGDSLVSQSLPGVDEGDVALVESTLDLPGVYRSEEAANKAASRVERMRNRVRVSWTSTDKAIQWSKGTVVRHQMSLRGTDLFVRITNVQLVGYGRYQVTGMRYDASHYPSEVDVPTTTGTVPVGAILPMTGDTIPAGYEAYTLADGRFIICAGNTYSEGDTGGSATHSGFIGSTTSVDSHGSTALAEFQSRRIEQGGEFGSFKVPADAPDLTHSHSYSTGTITPNLIRREHKLVKKTGSAGASVPQALRIFGLQNLSVSGLTRVVSEANRLLMASTVNQLAGAAQFVTLTSGSASDGHFHLSGGLGNTASDLAPVNRWYDTESAGGAHTHNFSMPLDVSVQRINVPLWASADDYPVVPGMIVLWDGGTLPAGWDLCDGSNSTPDLRDYFIQISPDGEEFNTAGDNTLSINGSGTPVGHHHQGAENQSGFPIDGFDHSNTVTHTHEISASSSYTPAYYALSAIMFNP